MGLIREPKNVDFIIKSEPWTEKELEEFRKIMKAQKERKKKHSRDVSRRKTKQNA